VTAAHETLHLYPQVDRLLGRIEALDSPLIQLWDWPGSGAAVVLEALLARHGRRAVALSQAALAGEEPLREAIAAAQEEGVRWLVANGSPDESWRPEAERWLRPGQRLVFAAGRCGGVDGTGALPRGIVPPQEMLLVDREIAELWHLLTGGDLSPADARSLREATDGWYQPVRRAIETTGGLDLLGASPEALLEFPAVRRFLRHEVLDLFSEEERDLLLAAPEERPEAGDAGEDAWRLLDEHGLWIEGVERDRLPRLLAAALERERRRRRPRAAAGSPVDAPPSGAASGPGRGGSGPPVYVLGLLGSPVARQRDEEGERDLDLRLRRAFQVLAFLASSPGLQAGREELMDAVWPTEGERTIERNFHPTLSHLRRSLESGAKGKGRPSQLLFRNGVYRLNPETVWEVDALEMTRRVDEGKERAGRGELEAAAEVWRQAWRLYRGPFLQGYYEGWVTLRREAYQRLYLDLLRGLGDLYLRLERNEDALDAYRAVLLEDQLQERVHVAVMRIYALQGRRDLVRRQYDNLCRVYLEELGVSPGEETTTEYHRLMA
jgi:DNA-binding SARP family transcriptional activator